MLDRFGPDAVQNREQKVMRYRFNWRTAVIAGLIAGLIFLVLEMIMVPLFAGGSAWTQPRMIAGIVMGEEVVPPPATFDFGIFLVALLIHLGASVVLGLIFALIVMPVSLPVGAVIGGVLGLVLYFINFYGFSAFWPWFEDARHWVTVFTHISFGVAAAWSYKGLQARWGEPISTDEAKS
jgi:hypothetical protein